MSGLKAFVLGATGETGKELVNILASSNRFGKVTIIGRRKLDFEQEKYKSIDQVMVDFDQLGEHKNAFDGYDVGFCCLGTTKAKSGASGFVKVDRDYVYESAQFAKEGGCKQFHLLTAQNANKDSWFLYPRTKGEVEEKVTQLGFEKLFIYRPGLLLCDRQERRTLEKIIQVVAGSIDRWGKVSIPTQVVAQAMVNCCFNEGAKPVNIIEHSKLFELSR